MRIIDTTTFFEENMMMDIRFNILDPYVDKFIVCESLFTHSGRRKKINFNFENFPKFKDKIIHVILDKEPLNLIKKKNLSPQEKRQNSIYRIREQRNYIKTILNQFSSEDYIIYSDNDEIPNLEKFNLKLSKKKFFIFNQKIFYYKLNLGLPKLNWFGSKACKLKYLKSVDFLRNIKNKKYSFFRIDTFFRDDKQNSVEIIDDGGWHFSMIKKPEDIYLKQKNDEHYDEFLLSGIKINDIQDMVKENYIIYDHNTDKSEFSKKWNKRNRIYLTKINDSKLPEYLIENKNSYINWFA